MKTVGLRLLSRGPLPEVTCKAARSCHQPPWPCLPRALEASRQPRAWGSPPSQAVPRGSRNNRRRHASARRQRIQPRQPPPCLRILSAAVATKLVTKAAMTSTPRLPSQAARGYLWLSPPCPSAFEIEPKSSRWAPDWCNDQGSLAVPFVREQPQRSACLPLASRKWGQIRVYSSVRRKAALGLGGEEGGHQRNLFAEGREDTWRASRRPHAVQSMAPLGARFSGRGITERL